MFLEPPFAAALNHLLEAESWARERLAPFAGRTVELRGPALPALRLTIREDGGVRASSPDHAADLVMTVRPDALAALWRGEDHLMRAVDVAGDAPLADAVLALVRHLRWDAEEDLSRLVGDVAAHRAAGALRDLAAWHRDAAGRLAESAADYFAEEKRVLVRRAELDAFAAVAARLRDAVERLEKRVERLE